MALSAFFTVLALCAVYVAAATAAIQRQRWTPRMLSFASGISVSYVFLDLLPHLSEQQSEIDALQVLTWLDRHVYILALVGLITAFWVETASRESRIRQRRTGGPDHTEIAVYRLGIASSVVQHVAVGYAVGSPGDQAIEPLWLFAVALGLHFLVNDHSLVEHHGDRYQRHGRWWLVAALLAGWAIGFADSVRIPGVVLASALSYIAGGTILNILRHELPSTERSADVGAFVLGAACYTFLLLFLP